MDIEKLTDAEWKRHVARSFTEVNKKLADGQTSFEKIQETMKRIESNTELARNVQVFSNATVVIYRTIQRGAMPVIKTVLFFVACVIFIYMITHEGAVPVWSKPWLSFMEKLV